MFGYLLKKLSILFLLASILIAPVLLTNAFSQTSTSLQIYYFFSQDCQPCQTILQGYLPTLKPIYPFVEIKTFDVGNPAYYEVLLKLENRFSKKESELPVVLI